MGGKNYAQKGIEADRRIVAEEQAAQSAWAQRTFDTIVGRVVEVQGIGRCTVLDVNKETRRAIVYPVGATDEQGYDVPFSRVQLVA